jgi:hypothetical protein
MTTRQIRRLVYGQPFSRKAARQPNTADAVPLRDPLAAKDLRTSRDSVRQALTLSQPESAASPFGHVGAARRWRCMAFQPLVGTAALLLYLLLAFLPFTVKPSVERNDLKSRIV